MSDVDITELDELQASKVSGVQNAANGTPFLLLKAAAPKCSTCDDTGKIMEGNRDCPDCDVSKSNSAEADAMEEEILKAGDYCGNPSCGVCKALGLVNKALTAAERKEMPKASFAYVDPTGGRHLPIHDKGHTKAALGRFKSTDFTGADKPVAAKAKAAGKIKAAADKHGIEIDPESDVATAAKKGAVQDGLNGTATPQEAGHLATGHSSLAGPSTNGVQGAAVPAAEAVGGASHYGAPAEAKLTKGLVVASLVGAMDALAEQRQAVKDGKFLQTANAALTEPKIPLTELASTLASCVGVLEEYLLCERVEAAVDPSEQSDVWDLEDAKSSLKYALRLVAIFATMESLEAETATKNLDGLITVRQTLDDAIGAAKATQVGSAGSTEETITVTDVTKSELAETIAASTIAAVEAAFKAKADEAEVAAKEKADADAEAEKNANNGGDISESEIKPTKETDADDVNAVKSEKDEGDEPETALTKQVADQLEALTKGLQSVEETVAKIAKRPRAGGPSLDGQARGGASPAAEGRLGDVTKSTGDVDIEQLQKSLDEETDPVRKSELGLKLTYAKLVQMHESGRL
jgi:hypothetical protein